MKILLSCAKKQHNPVDFVSNVPLNAEGWLDRCEMPHYQQNANVLAAIMRKMHKNDIKSLMSISAQLAELNHSRFQNFNDQGAEMGDAIPALWFFAGDAYRALDAATLSHDAVDYLSHSLCIMSGLYGILSALDWVQPYRLEMKTLLTNPAGSDLYQFWQTMLTEQMLLSNDPILNLASQEYSKVLDKSRLLDRWVDVTFYNYDKSGVRKVIGIRAKKARGKMVRWCAEHLVSDVDEVKKFDCGYRFDESESNDKHLVFSEV